MIAPSRPPRWRVAKLALALALAACQAAPPTSTRSAPPTVASTRAAVRPAAASAAPATATRPPPRPTRPATATASTAANSVPSATSAEGELPPVAETALLFDYDPAAPLELEVIATETGSGATVYDVRYLSPKGGPVPAYVVAPAGDGPFAGVVLLHGSGTTRASQLPFAHDLARAGAVSIMIDAPFNRPEHADHHTWALTLTERDRDEQIQLIVDLRRAVDVLTGWPGVDPARLAFVGYSMGGAQGGLLAGVEHRVRAYGLMVGDGGWVDHLTTPAGERLPDLRDLPDEQWARWLAAMRPIEPIRFVGHAAPAALFFLNARHDTSVTREDAEAYQAAGSDPKQVAWYASGHGLPRQAYLDLVAWLAEQIGIDPAAYAGP
jgi:dienelactone hydrolase